MSDLAAAEAEAEVAREGPRFSVFVGCVVGFLGSAGMAVLVILLLGWAKFLPADATLWIVLLAGLAYAIALLVWAGLWRRPLAVAAVLASSLAGLACGFILGLVLLWMAVPGARPNLVLG